MTKNTPGLLRHNARERERRYLHHRQIWLMDAVVTDKERHGYRLPSDVFHHRGFVVRSVTEEFGERTVLTIKTDSSAPAAKPGVVFTNWRIDS